MLLRTDEDLAVGVQRGNADDLAVLVERHHSPLLGYLYRMAGGDRSLVEDLVQETFLRVLRAIGQYQYPRPFKPWLYAIATNLVRDHYKRAETRYTVGETGEELTRGQAVRPEDRVVADEEAQQVAAAVMALPVHQREAVILRYYQSLSLAEIADALGVPLGTVKSRLYHGLRRLRATLE
jgi:RNA polymerase sigma-70 factor (ECF subfamily)